jgi:hypothetical protein
VSIFLDNVTANEAPAIFGWNDRSVTGKRHLSAMRMAGERQGNTLGHGREDIRLVCHEQDRRIIADLLERSRQVVDTVEDDPATQTTRPHLAESKLITEASKPEGSAILRQPSRVVLVYWDAGRLERAMRPDGAASPHRCIRIIPPVVIAENGMDAERRFETCENAGPFGCRYVAMYEAVMRHVVAEQQNEIGPERIRIGDDLFDPIEIHPRLARVDICDEGDPEMQIMRPGSEARAVTHDAMAPRLHAERVTGEAEGRNAESRNGLEKCATRKHSPAAPWENLKQRMIDP